jgi:hypothetical protein
MCYSSICSVKCIWCTQLTWSVQNHATTGGKEQLSETKEKRFINITLYSLYTILLISSRPFLSIIGIIRSITCHELASSGLLFAKNWHQAYYVPRIAIIRHIIRQELASSGLLLTKNWHRQAYYLLRIGIIRSITCKYCNLLVSMHDVSWKVCVLRYTRTFRTRSSPGIGWSLCQYQNTCM